jgi:hypothetical protein
MVMRVGLVVLALLVPAFLAPPLRVVHGSGASLQLSGAPRTAAPASSLPRFPHAFLPTGSLAVLAAAAAGVALRGAKGQRGAARMCAPDGPASADQLLLSALDS